MNRNGNCLIFLVNGYVCVQCLLIGGWNGQSVGITLFKLSWSTLVAVVVFSNNSKVVW